MDTRAVDGLQQQLKGAVLTSTHPSYDQARRVWNGMVDRRPLVIVQPETAAAVAAAVGFARDQGLPLSVKGAGHGVAGRAVCDDGVVIDLARMGRVQVDAAAGVATVQGGATLRTLDAGAQAHGLATTAGIFRGTGVVGLALGGGIGLLMRRYGLTCDNLLAAEVVTADGRVLEASERQHPDLFWALRGGGGNFGVVTRMDVRLHPLADVYGGRMSFPYDQVDTLGRVYAETMADAPDELQIYFSVGTGGAWPSASVMLCDCGDRGLGEQTRHRLRRSLHPTADQVQRMPYLRMQQHWDCLLYTSPSPRDS